MSSKDDLSDLLGEGKKSKGKSKKSKGKPKAKPAKKEKSAKKSKGKKSGKGNRSGSSKKANRGFAPRGKGKFYFPKGDGTERAKLAAGILKRLKMKTTCEEFAEKFDIPTWKVRLASKDLWRQKKIKRDKNNVGRIVMSPK